MPGERKIWFPAKRYGYGWSFPVCWQGWVAIGIYGCLFALGASQLLGRYQAIYFVLWVALLTLALLLVCIWRGERPRWRWGGK